MKGPRKCSRFEGGISAESSVLLQRASTAMYSRGRTPENVFTDYSANNSHNLSENVTESMEFVSEAFKRQLMTSTIGCTESKRGVPSVEKVGRRRLDLECKKLDTSLDEIEFRTSEANGPVIIVDKPSPSYPSFQGNRYQKNGREFQLQCSSLNMISFESKQAQVIFDKHKDELYVHNSKCLEVGQAPTIILATPTKKSHLMKEALSIAS